MENDFFELPVGDTHNHVGTRETVTFSRALHLMRYSGLKMASIHWPKGFDIHLKVIDGQLRKYTDEGEVIGFLLNPVDLMGSWVEVK